MTTHKVGYLIGSLAKGSINRKLAKALVQLAPSNRQMQEISFKELPLYSYDYDADFPPVARAFKKAIADVDGAPVPSCPAELGSNPKKLSERYSPQLIQEPLFNSRALISA